MGAHQGFGQHRVFTGEWRLAQGEQLTDGLKIGSTETTPGRTGQEDLTAPREADSCRMHSRLQTVAQDQIHTQELKRVR
jgi:hypothetical protein